MYKFYTKGDKDHIQAAIFYNGQRIATLFSIVYSTGEILVTVEDGNFIPQVEWTDYEESP